VLYLRSFSDVSDVDGSGLAEYAGGGPFIKGVFSVNNSSLRRGDVGEAGVYEIGEIEERSLERTDA
jgi:hypothetical protein